MPVTTATQGVTRSGTYRAAFLYRSRICAGLASPECQPSLDLAASPIPSAPLDEWRNRHPEKIR